MFFFPYPSCKPSNSISASWFHRTSKGMSRSGSWIWFRSILTIVRRQKNCCAVSTNTLLESVAGLIANERKKPSCNAESLDLALWPLCSIFLRFFKETIMNVCTVKGSVRITSCMRFPTNSELFWRISWTIVLSLILFVSSCTNRASTDDDWFYVDSYDIAVECENILRVGKCIQPVHAGQIQSWIKKLDDAHKISIEYQKRLRGYQRHGS